MTIDNENRLEEIMQFSDLPEEKKIKAMNYFNDVAYNIRQEMECKMGNRPITDDLRKLFNTAVESATLFYVNHQMKENTASNKCMWYNVSRNQRSIELERRAGLEGTKNYKDMGCYVCDGYKNLCDYRLESHELQSDQNTPRNDPNAEGWCNGQW
jgi:hypothetical protein